MYSSTDLARMFGTTKVTINRKFKDKSLSPFLVKTKSKNNGKVGYMLKVEGLNQLQLLMAESKVSKSFTTNNKDISNTFPSAKTEDYKDNNKNDNTKSIQAEYIQNLKEQIKKQDEQIEYLKNQVENKETQINKKDEIIEKHVLLVQHSQKLLEEKEKLLIESKEQKEKSWLKRIFGN